MFFYLQMKPTYAKVTCISKIPLIVSWTVLNFRMINSLFSFPYAQQKTLKIFLSCVNDG